MRWLRLWLGWYAEEALEARIQATALLATVKKNGGEIVGSQYGELTQGTVGVKPVDVPQNRADMLVWLVMLFCREKDGRPAGILPRAFSDKPRSCCKPFSSVTEAKDGLREV